MKILIAAGGTGGHLFPALAVTEAMIDISKINIDFHFFGRRDKIEGRVVPGLGYTLHTTKLSGLVNLFSFNTVKLPFQIAGAVCKLVRLIRRESIEAVICTGAYLSYPAGIAAKLCKKKLFLMESNVNPGKAISMLASRADIIFTTFDETENFFPTDIKPKLKNFGNPIRQSIIKKAWQMANNPDKSDAYNLFNLKKNIPVLLVFGGSLGAKTINDAILKWKDSFAAAPYQILWQTGATFNSTAKANMAASNGKPDLLPANIRCVEFIDDMATAYSVADLVVCRSGATTVAELCIAGKPSVLVPLPSASNNEQHYNATYLTKHGAAEIVSNTDIAEKLFDIVNKLMLNEAQLEQMGQVAHTLAKPDAGYKIAKEIVGMV